MKLVRILHLIAISITILALVLDILDDRNQVLKIN